MSDHGCVVHVARVSGSAAALAGAASVLSDLELRRATTIRDGAARARFELGALLVRTVAGGALGMAPRSVPVDRSCDRCARPHGRPRVPGSAVHLSVSHSGDLVVVATSRVGPVGVDVEEVTTAPFDHSALADLVCAPGERPAVIDRESFLTCWTRKESVLKATGDGLRIPPAEVVLTPPGTRPRLVSFRGRPGPECQLADVDLGPRYRAAVTVLDPSPLAVTVVEEQLRRG
ncbi:MAG: 4'-phosphopantetheinyl transferase superfamily protein [Actinobacteria bacterium]|nr:4'-phosphopantetheinyl transferase superfamily protein [Actinomycetota bacterium]MCG2801733.1 4'-phosphopantetheinyl transferase superfamily protein [Cellulomonas sp.]